MYPRVALTAAICLAVSTCLSAEKDKPTQTKPADAPQKQASPPAVDKSGAGKTDDARREYDAKYREWKQLVARLYLIKERYQTEQVVNEDALMNEYKDVMAKAQALADPLVDDALKAYEAAPNQDAELSEFLFATLKGYVMGDDFEKGARIAKVMTDNNNDNRELPLIAGLTFFGSNDFDAAGKYLQQAKETGTINQEGLKYLGQIEKYKTMWEKEQTLRAAEDKAKNLPKVKISTSKGDIVLVLFENEAPIATANFISLIESGFYNNLTFHRVIGGFMAQGGDPKGDGSGGPGYAIPCECQQENHRNHFRGSLSMAHAGRDTGGSQFFITFVPALNLDGKHTVFGRVVEGLDVLAKLQRIEPGTVGEPDRIIKATVISKRKHPYIPIKRFDKDRKKEG